MTLETLSEQRCFGGVQGIYRHQSTATGTPMRFAVFVPPGEGPFPVLWFLAGLTCTEENFVTKAGAQRAAAEHGLILIAPDTSPRGDDVPDDDGYDFGKGAGFYVDATEAPWSANYQMRSYIESELPTLIAASFAADMGRQGITGHSMGGHGALTVALRNPERFGSVSAFAPIVSPLYCPWGDKALTGYLGADRTAWRAYDACALIEKGAHVPEILVDQGDADQFLTEQLKPQLLADACHVAGIDLTLRMQPGYDHSYYFIASFIADHIAWHAARLA
ncbi:S-formylglutathione hydrolase [Sphingomonas bacterium]|uniref:S-formylglutathione hydrolase n=1 Tax=Sphingomonas bacterium TaxID=1895847 RepID=UPI00260A44BA|nr:S-formylglutathione hydrolase [Sphingomonas bacterium]MDB5680169.1 S-formylglutathione hydrolase [Sphingomonas bacterium]